MRSSVLVGFVLGALLIAGWYLFPVVLDDAARVNALEARETAELARRQLDRYSPIAAEGANYVQAQTMLSESDFQSLSDAQQAKADAHQQEFDGVEFPPPAPLTATPEDMRRAIEGFDTRLAGNDAFLDQAVSSARQASQLVSGQPIASVAMIQAAAHMNAAIAKLREAGRIRLTVDEALSESFSFAVRERYQKDMSRYFSSIDTDPIIEALRGGEGGQAQLQEQLESTQANLNSLNQQITQKEQQLASIQTQLKRAQQERLRLEETRANDGIGYEAFRSTFAGVMRNLAQLQEQEQLLLMGGLKGATLDPVDPVNGPITGGEEVQGIVDLKAEKYRLELMQERLTGGIDELDKQVKQVQKSAELAEEASGTYGTKADEYRAAMISAQSPVQELTAQAMAIEDEALAAARAARSAFEVVDRAVIAFKRGARDVQSSRDPERQNARLKSILADSLVEEMGKTGEAAARTIEARVLLLRLTSVERQRQLLSKIARVADAQIQDEQTLADLIDAARKDGLDTLDAALEIYQEVNQSEINTNWATLAGQGAAIYLKSRFDQVRSQDLAFEAARVMQDAVDGREQSPYLAKHVIFRDYLSDRTGFTGSSIADNQQNDADDPNSTDPNNFTDPNQADQDENPFGDDADDPFDS